jgi:hypothetical protein
MGVADTQQDDAETGGRGDTGAVSDLKLVSPRPRVSASPCPRVSVSPRPRVPASHFALQLKFDFPPNLLGHDTAVHLC